MKSYCIIINKEKMKRPSSKDIQIKSIHRGSNAKGRTESSKKPNSERIYKIQYVITINIFYFSKDSIKE